MYNNRIANIILNSFKTNPIGTEEKYGITFDIHTENIKDITDTVEQLIKEKKIKASISKRGSSYIVFDER
ncbi:MAG: hypothetical protein LKF43_11660 [Streptococcaceae bacterium]|jgi:hypothetical protein|nr:hypothetical protein [Streptococcaceae bacterium]